MIMTPGVVQGVTPLFPGTGSVPSKATDVNKASVSKPVARPRSSFISKGRVIKASSNRVPPPPPSRGISDERRKRKPPIAPRLPPKRPSTSLKLKIHSASSPSSAALKKPSPFKRSSSSSSARSISSTRSTSSTASKRYIARGSEAVSARSAEIKQKKSLSKSSDPTKTSALAASSDKKKKPPSLANSKKHTSSATRKQGTMEVRKSRLPPPQRNKVSAVRNRTAPIGQQEGKAVSSAVRSGTAPIGQQEGNAVSSAVRSGTAPIGQEEGKAVSSDDLSMIPVTTPKKQATTPVSTGPKDTDHAAKYASALSRARARRTAVTLANKQETTPVDTSVKPVDMQSKQSESSHPEKTEVKVVITQSKADSLGHLEKTAAPAAPKETPPEVTHADQINKKVALSDHINPTGTPRSQRPEGSGVNSRSKSNNVPLSMNRTKPHTVTASNGLDPSSDKLNEDYAVEVVAVRTNQGFLAAGILIPKAYQSGAFSNLGHETKLVAAPTKSPPKVEVDKKPPLTLKWRSTTPAVPKPTDLSSDSTFYRECLHMSDSNSILASTIVPFRDTDLESVSGYSDRTDTVISAPRHPRNEIEEMKEIKETEEERDETASSLVKSAIEGMKGEEGLPSKNETWIDMLDDAYFPQFACDPEIENVETKDDDDQSQASHDRNIPSMIKLPSPPASVVPVQQQTDVRDETVQARVEPVEAVSRQASF